MAEISVRITRDDTPELMQKLDAALGRFVVKGIGYLDGEVKSAMAEPKTGKSYKRGKSGIHRASAPGESPASDSGNLIGSIQQIYPSTLEGLLGTNVEYAIWLEDLTGLNRPLWQKERDEGLPTLERMLKEEVEGIR